jgi:tetratricopeptide (TPR) repeat protein
MTRAFKLQEALQNLEGQGQMSQTLKLDEAELRRRFEERKNRAEAHYQKEEHAKAEKIYTQILDSGETTESVQLYPLLGMCSEQLGDLQGAIAAYRRCLEIVPGRDVAAMCGFSLGRILWFDKKDPGGAERALTAATTSQILDIRVQAMFWLGTIAHDRRDVEAALRRYRDIYALRDSEFTLFPSVIPLAALQALSTVCRYQHRSPPFTDHRDLPSRNG